ncbi:redox-sensitive transcriptional activator SoxR [uncultured Acinetobacter sp.]|uniref:redox-sensitive transcriptional activator SoxR n=1 Tax=uncultured Acinetobacter sp. TaxID=165433 RepID=UPI0025839838|nr:redox-sensitive transcriptional activator SoxR [uncultured Acinetobacter sp.]
MKQENLAQQFITIGELAKRSGVSVSTIRFYEEKQLIWSIRTNGNQRRYVRAMLRRIAIIKVAQLVGISLEGVKQAFSVLPDRKMASKQDWENMSNLWKNQLEEKIQTLLQIRQQLDWCIGCGCLSLDQCPLRNPDDYYASQSNGAHFQKIQYRIEPLEAED